MLLEDKKAVVYGAGGAIGGAVASAFAREGARAFQDTGELGGHLDRGLVGAANRDRGADEGTFVAGSGGDAADVGNAVAFLASDLAGATTGTVFDLASGTVVD